MQSKTFASEYPRNEEGLILFPRDPEYRKELFPWWNRLGISLEQHPAKANLYLVQAIIEYASEPGDTVADIMAGTGSILTAVLIGRRVVCIELEEEYQNFIEEATKDMEAIAPGAEDMITLIPGDCSKVLPVYGLNHIIFSPPYSNIFKKKTLDKLTSELGIGKAGGILSYSSHPDNIGNLNEFLYHQVMERIYKKTLESLEPGGTLTIILKDHIGAGKRVYLGERAARDCVRAGYELVAIHKWLPPGSAYVGFMRARGDLVVDDESIIILRKP